MVKLLEGFDFNDALENDINVADDNINQITQQIYINEILNIFKNYMFTKVIINKINNTNIIITANFKNETFCININNEDDKLIICHKNYNNYFVTIVNNKVIPHRIINVCKDLIKCNKQFFISNKVEVELCIDFNTEISKFNNLFTYILNNNDLYFINEFIKIGCDVVYKKYISTNNFQPLKNENIIILYEDNSIPLTELKNVINYIDEHYMAPDTFMFISYYNIKQIYNIDDFDKYFFNGPNLIKFNDNYISYDKNNVKVNSTDIQLVCRNVIEPVKKESGLKKIISKIGNNPEGIAKFYSRAVLSIIMLFNYNVNTFINNIIVYNKNIKFDPDIFKAYYNKIHDDIVQHGLIYQTIRKYLNK